MIWRAIDQKKPSAICFSPGRINHTLRAKRFVFGYKQGEILLVEPNAEAQFISVIDITFETNSAVSTIQQSASDLNKVRIHR